MQKEFGIFLKIIIGQCMKQEWKGSEDKLEIFDLFSPEKGSRFRV